MDVDYFIAMIYDRPTIWDKNTKEHGTRVAVDRAWKEISLEMNVNEITLRKKWKSLRDYFIMEHHKRCASTKPGDGPENSKWLHYKQLQFLRDQIGPKSSGTPSLSGSFCYDDISESPGRTPNYSMMDESSLGPAHHDGSMSNISAEENYSKIANDFAEHADNEQQDRDAAATLPSPSQQHSSVGSIKPELLGGPADPRSSVTTTTTRKRKRKAATNPYENLYETQQLNLRLKYLSEQNRLNEEESDADLLFWKSLQPYVKQIPDHLQLSFRHRVQLLVEEYVFGSQDGVPSSRIPNGHDGSSSSGDIACKYEPAQEDSDETRD